MMIVDVEILLLSLSISLSLSLSLTQLTSIKPKDSNKPASYRQPWTPEEQVIV